MLNYLQQDPWGFLQFMLYRAPAVLLALTLHEFAHGYAALKAGDLTAKRMGRLSLNPLKHLDPIGTVSLFLLGFGWAKPVPVNPNNYRNPRRDDIVVSLAGVTTNFVLFVLSTILAMLIGKGLYEPAALNSLGGLRFFLDFNEVGYAMQLYPDAAEMILPVLKTPWLLHVQRFVLHSCMINLGLCLFNLLPIPPLDGFHVLNQTLFRGKLQLGGQVFRYAQLGLIVLMFTTDIVGNILQWLMNTVQSGVLAVLGV